MEPIRNGMFAGTDYKLDQLEKHLKKRPAYNSYNSCVNCLNPDEVGF